MDRDTKRISPSAKCDQVELSIEQTLSLVRQALAQIRYGTIEIKVQEGKPVWVDKHERERVG